LHGKKSTLGSSYIIKLPKSFSINPTKDKNKNNDEEKEECHDCKHKKK